MNFAITEKLFLKWQFFSFFYGKRFLTRINQIDSCIFLLMDLPIEGQSTCHGRSFYKEERFTKNNVALWIKIGERYADIVPSCWLQLWMKQTILSLRMHTACM